MSYVIDSLLFSLFRAHVRGVDESSVVNLCERHGSLVSLKIIKNLPLFLYWKRSDCIENDTVYREFIDTEDTWYKEFIFL